MARFAPSVSQAPALDIPSACLGPDEVTPIGPRPAGEYVWGKGEGEWRRLSESPGLDGLWALWSYSG